MHIVGHNACAYIWQLATRVAPTSDNMTPLPDKICNRTHGTHLAARRVLDGEHGEAFATRCDSLDPKPTRRRRQRN